MEIKYSIDGDSATVVGKLVSDPSSADTDGDGDFDDIDPSPMQYVLNEYFIEQLGKLYNLAVEYNNNNRYLDVPGLYSIGRSKWLPFMFLRSLQLKSNGKRSYDNAMWTITAGDIDEGFIDFVKYENPELYNYFKNTPEIYAYSSVDNNPSEWEKLDLYHMAATISAYIFDTQTVLNADNLLLSIILPKGESVVKTITMLWLQAGILSEKNIDNLAGWAGDIQTLVTSDIIDKNNSSQIDNYQKAKNVFSEVFLTKTSNFSLEDFYSDVDAKNIYHDLKYTSRSFKTILRDYYSYRTVCRIHEFVDYKPMSDFRTYVEIYVNQTYSGVQWTLYIKDTENYNYEINNKITALLTGNIYTIPNHLRDAVVDGFTEYIFSRINEENAGD